MRAEERAKQGVAVLKETNKLMRLVQPVIIRLASVVQRFNELLELLLLARAYLAEKLEKLLTAFRGKSSKDDVYKLRRTGCTPHIFDMAPSLSSDRDEFHWSRDPNAHSFDKVIFLQFAGRCLELYI